MPECFDLVVIGGGPAGCAAAISAARRGKRVALLEAGRYPRHKVCGEFLSAESLILLRELLLGTSGIDLLDHSPHIAKARVFLPAGGFDSRIEPAAASISRYDLDFALWNAARANGVDARDGCGRYAVARGTNEFLVLGGGPGLVCKHVIYATGRRSDRGTSVLVGLKSHFRVQDRVDSVELYFGDEGYCGVQPLGGGLLNVCALVNADSIKGSGSDRMSAAFAEHERLREKQWEQVTETVTTATCPLGDPQPLWDGIVCAGDAAGFIDPFLGDGISLALQSGAIAGSIDDPQQYEREYRRRFVPLFRRAAQLRRLLHSPAALQKAALLLMKVSPISAAIVAATRVTVRTPADRG
jgi:flavin-dependent dehydrogenase